jgi:hypothetical protein
MKKRPKECKKSLIFETINKAVLLAPITLALVFVLKDSAKIRNPPTRLLARGSPMLAKLKK